MGETHDFEVKVEEAQEAVRVLLRYLGEDPTRAGLIETPRRYVAFLEELKCNSCVDIFQTSFENIRGLANTKISSALVVSSFAPSISITCTVRSVPGFVEV